MHTTRILPALIAAIALTVSCGDDDASPGDITTTITLAVTTTATVDVASTAAVATTTTAGDAATATSGTVELEQPAIWPASEVVFESPEEAAADFVAQVLGVDPVLGEFEGGDSRSGAIEVFSPGENVRVSRGVLLLRQLGADDGWFVIGAANPNATIRTPEPNAEVAAAALTVEGVARGFEATVVVSAFLSGDADAVLDQVITNGGAFETPEPYGATIDLTGASPGDVVTVLVRGDTGLHTDPGEFGAIPVVIVG